MNFPSKSAFVVCCCSSGFLKKLISKSTWRSMIGFNILFLFLMNGKQSYSFHLNVALFKSRNWLWLTLSYLLKADWLFSSLLSFIPLFNWLETSWDLISSKSDGKQTHKLRYNVNTRNPRIIVALNETLFFLCYLIMLISWHHSWKG